MLRLLANLFRHTIGSEEPSLHARLRAKFNDPEKVAILDGYLEACLSRHHHHQTDSSSDDLVRLGNIMHHLSDSNDHFKGSLERIRGKQ